MGPQYPDDIDKLRVLVREGIDSGPPVDGPLAMKRLLTKYEIVTASAKVAVTQTTKS